MRAGIQPPEPRESPPDRDRDVRHDVVDEEQALFLAVLADVADAIPLERLSGDPDLRDLAVDTDLASDRPVDADDGLSHLAPTGADQPVEPEVLARVDNLRLNALGARP